MKLHIKSLIPCLLISGIITSCLEKQEDEFTVIGAVPTVVLLNEPPEEVNVGESFDIEYRYFSPHVAVNRITITENITSAGGTQKADSEIFNEPISNFNTADSYERSFEYTVNNAALEAGDVITITITLSASNNLSGLPLVITTNVSN